jgi:hypothetical protein
LKALYGPSFGAVDGMTIKNFKINSNVVALGRVAQRTRRGRG